MFQLSPKKLAGWAVKNEDASVNGNRFKNLRVDIVGPCSFIVPCQQASRQPSPCPPSSTVTDVQLFDVKGQQATSFILQLFSRVYVSWVYILTEHISGLLFECVYFKKFIKDGFRRIYFMFLNISGDQISGVYKLSC